MATKEEFLGLMKYCLSTTAIVFIIISCTHGKTRFFPEREGLNNPVEVTVIRNRGFCAAYPTAILLDEVPIAFIRIGEYVTFFVESGVHYLRVDTGVSGNFEKENKYYFLISPNFFDSIGAGAGCSFEIEKISEEEGLKRVMNSKNLIEMEKPHKIQTETTPPEKEKPNLASIPKNVTLPEISLRGKPMEISNEMQITNMLIEYNFFERSRNTQGSFVNEFVDNNDGTVTDKVTGLMWQKDGSSGTLDNQGAISYIEQLNRQRFAGHSDWRMPTIEELASLLERTKNEGVHMDPIFDSRQTSCWSADTGEGVNAFLSGAWIVNFGQGQILKADFLKTSGAPQSLPYGPRRNYLNHAKAVRWTE